MAINTTLIEVKDRGWLNGFGPLWHKESHAWWGTGSWLVKVLIWTAIIDGMLALITLMGQTEASQADEPLEQTALMVYFMFAAIIPACGVIIFSHETIIDERKMGTAAWVLSKPVSRAAFLLSKFSADAVGVLMTQVVIQGVIAFFLYRATTGITLSIPGFLAGVGLIYLFLIFYLALTTMLGTLFQSRGPVIGIPLVIISCGFLPMLMPSLAKVMPSSLVMNLGSGRLSLAEILAQGGPLPTVMPILTTAIMAILFIIVALVRFGREEF